MIVKKGSEFCVLSANGDKNLGCYPTRAEAEARLKQVERFKGDSIRVTRRDRIGPIEFIEDEDKTQSDESWADKVTARLTPEGFLRVNARISGVGVYDYNDGEGDSWGELRSPEEVFEQKAIDSFAMKPVTDDHPAEFVDSTNIGTVQKGHIGTDLKRDASNFLVADMLITDAELIEKIKGGKAELSCGYEALMIPEKGTFDGKSYDYLQTSIRGNHVAVVDQARGGPELRPLLDAKAEAVPHQPVSKKVHSMKIKDGKIVIGEESYDVPDEQLVKMLESLKSAEAPQDAPQQTTPAPQVAPTPTPQVAGKDSTDALKAKVDMLEAALADLKKNESNRIDARVKLIADARSISAEIKVDGMSDIDIQRQVVATITPALKAKVDTASPDYVQACFDAALEMHKERVAKKGDSSMDLLALTHEAAKQDQSMEVDLDKLYAGRLDALRNSVKTQKEAN